MTDTLIRALTAEPWAIQSDWLHAIWAIATRQPKLSEKNGGNWTERNIEAAVGPGPKRLEGTRYAVVDDNIAVVPIFGPIFPRANMMTEMSGATSADMLKRDIGLSVANPSVHAIMMLVDSPGGAVSGVSAVADAVFTARGAKPIISHVSGTAASAAYWIASAANEIRLERTGIVGSIGVAALVPRQVAPDASGEINVEIVSSSAPNKRPDPESDDGRAEIVRSLDAIEAAFIIDVARGRGVTAKVVKSDFGQGGVRIGSDAVQHRMADRVSSYEQSLTALKRLTSTRKRVEVLRV
jgi:ClpP class serine protease